MRHEADPPKTITPSHHHTTDPKGRAPVPTVPYPVPSSTSPEEGATPRVAAARAPCPAQPHGCAPVRHEADPPKTITPSHHNTTDPKGCAPVPTVPYPVHHGGCGTQTGAANACHPRAPTAHTAGGSNTLTHTHLVPRPASTTQTPRRRSDRMRLLSQLSST